MSELKPWEEGYVAPAPNPHAQQQAMAIAREANDKRVKAKKAADPNFDQFKKDPTSKAEKKRKSKAINDEEAAIKPKRKAFLNEFIHQYLYDFNATAAYVRAGGKAGGAANAAYKALREGYCQRRLQDLIEAMDEEDLVRDKEIIIGLKKEANTFGEGSSQTGRVSAWKLLAQLKGKLIKKTENTNHTTGGVMLIPVHATTEEWEQVAQASQEQLKHDVRT